jgi:hypothetical protein
MEAVGFVLGQGNGHVLSVDEPTEDYFGCTPRSVAFQ